MITNGDDLIASFKFSRYNNYKKNLYPSLEYYEDP